MKRVLLYTFLVCVFSLIVTVLVTKSPNLERKTTITNFEECVDAGNPVMETYPAQCKEGKQIFVEYIGNELEKLDLIRVAYPRPNQIIDSPLVITGEARGSWYFEASFPIVLTNWDGLIIAEGVAMAKGDWMTNEFVPFEATLTFTMDNNAYSNKASLILQKDNPSGLPENDDALEIPIILAKPSIISPTQTSRSCTQEVKTCPDGSFVSRIGPNCEFARCPTAEYECINDSDCPSSQYICQEVQGSGTACPDNDPTCNSTHIIIEGECKLKVGNSCSIDSDCVSGNLCHKNICIAPIGRECSGADDKSCPLDFECVQGCGAPLAREGEPPPKYYCQLKGYTRICPICLAEGTLIDTPRGLVPVENLQDGMSIWTINKSGKRVEGKVIKWSNTQVPVDHEMVKLLFADGRSLLVSPGHPTIDGRTVGNIEVGEIYDKGRVISVKRVNYNGKYTFDILPSGETGYYFANGILVDSTLH